MTNRKLWLAAMLCVAGLSGCGGSDSSVDSADGDAVEVAASADATVVNEGTPSALAPVAEAASGTSVDNKRE